MLLTRALGRLDRAVQKAKRLAKRQRIARECRDALKAAIEEKRKSIQDLRRGL
jgi:hypothetical protein